jgi:hypothetical protein
MDLLVESEPGQAPGPIALAGIEAELSSLIGGRGVDLWTPQELSPLFASRFWASPTSSMRPDKPGACAADGDEVLQPVEHVLRKAAVASDSRQRITAAISRRRTRALRRLSDSKDARAGCQISLTSAHSRALYPNPCLA